MVLESLFPYKKILEKKIYAFFLGVIYSTVSILVAIYLFPNDFIIFAVALTSLLFLPLINKLLEIEKDIELKRKGVDVKRFLKDHREIFQIYLFIFLGISLTFGLFVLVASNTVIDYLFENRAEFTMDLYMNPSSLRFGDFFTIIGNNVKVVLVCYLAAFAFGTGAIFIISWNASVWGTIFGSIAKSAAMIKEMNPFLFFISLSVVVLPHLIIEASAYFVAGIAGGIVSKILISERKLTRNFEIIIKKSLFLLWMSLFLVFMGALAESQLAPVLFSLIL